MSVAVAVAAFVFTIAIAAALTPLVRGLAIRGGLVDHALTSRKIHRRPIPRLGGLAIVGAFYATVLVLVASGSMPSLFEGDVHGPLGLLIGGLVVAGVGLWDDVRGVRARHKLAVQVAAAILAWVLGFRIEQIASPFGPAIDLGFVGLPFTVLWITGVVNAMNLIDGLDGLAAGIALIASFATLVVATMEGQILLAVLAATLSGAIIGFLFYNFNPASIFMGDSGSMFLGFILATMAIQGNQKSTAATAIIVPVIALAIPIADTLLAMGRRTLRGAPLFGPDREHVHHRLLALGLSHRQAVLALWTASLLLAVAAVVLAKAPGTTTALALVLLVTGGVALAVKRLGYLPEASAPDLLHARRRNLKVRGRIRELGRALHAAAEPAEIWHHVREAAPVLGADCVALSVAAGAGHRSRFKFVHGFEDAGTECLRARYSLLGERPSHGTIELGWRDGRSTVDRDTEIAVELLCEHVAAAVERIGRGATTAPGVLSAVPPLRRASGGRREA